MKSNLELLIILKREYKITSSCRIETCYQGLCGFIPLLFFKDLITKPEYYKLLEFLGNNKPFKQYNTLYYWQPGVKAPRLRWMTDNIRRLKQSS